MAEKSDHQPAENRSTEVCQMEQTLCKVRVEGNYKDHQVQKEEPWKVILYQD